MVRKQLYIDDDLDRRLAQRAEQLGVSQASLVREALDRLLADDRTAGQRAVAILEEMWAESDALGISSGGRKWTREELHER
jgi:hypothetical protein